ncbi:MAG: hypothetical protein EAZ95_15325 [Bacteroidetes bacterium]|nr:MAG: hypothetical protein EAZ95_15325 [Bacteroidota bacterium]
MRNVVLCFMLCLFCVPVQASSCLPTLREKTACLQKKAGKQIQKHHKKTRNAQKPQDWKSELYFFFKMIFGILGLLLGIVAWIIAGIFGSFVGLGWFLLGGFVFGLLVFWGLYLYEKM